MGLCTTIYCNYMAHHPKFAPEAKASTDKVLPNIRHNFGRLTANEQNITNTCIKHTGKSLCCNLGKWKHSMNFPFTKSLN